MDRRTYRGASLHLEYLSNLFKDEREQPDIDIDCAESRIIIGFKWHLPLEIKTNSFTKLLEKLNFSMMENVKVDMMTNGDWRPMPVQRVVDFVTILYHQRAVSQGELQRLSSFFFFHKISGVMLHPFI